MWGKKFWISELPALALGTALMALAVNLVYDPLGMVPGGFSGMSILLAHLSAGYMPFAFPVWSINILLNIPIFIWGFFEKGKEYIAKSLIANLFFSLMLFLIPVVPVAKEDFFLATVTGGVLTGAGIGLVFARGYSTGGTDLLGSLVKKYLPQFSVATLLFFADALIIFTGALYFGIAEAVYATVAVYISSKVMDNILTGLNRSKQILIISDKWQNIAREIMSKLERGVTEMMARGHYSGTERPVLLCVIGRRQVRALLGVIKKEDPTAFVVVTDAKEVIGEGFERIEG
ncbi:MAG: YitT family protein [Lachnospiraceae bacterium]|nr:YitT family protein [Lachnospiraceae bacterium]